MDYDTIRDEPIFDEIPGPTDLNWFTRIGFSHTNQCEDSIVVEESDFLRYVCGVFDGCSSGTESHFSSALIVKLLRKAVEEADFIEMREKQRLSSADFLKELFRIIFEDLKAINRQLRLKYDELLSTILIGVYDGFTKELSINVVGDGLIMVNEKIHELYCEHKSDYVGYHLDKRFDDFYEESVVKMGFENVTQFALSTDGIYSFKKLDHRKRKELNEEEVIEYILQDISYRDSPNWIQNKVDYLKDKFGMQPIDDIGIIIYSKYNAPNTAPATTRPS